MSDEPMPEGVLVAGDPMGCCGDALFWCPTTQDVECSIHGGFSQCCDMPELHRSIPALIEGAVMGEPDTKAQH